ncbi:MAG: methyltransferase domain-containing protein [Rhizobiaceae bacterium]
MGTIRKLLAKVTPAKAYKLHAYTGAGGQFDYERYRKAQVAGNKAKLGKVWVKRETVALIARYIEARGIKPEFGLCHGTRRGMEQKWFAEELGCRVLGTEISDTATQFPDTIEHDFHETRPEWIGACDFIYSNSFDHAYDPEKALTAWVSCLKPHGLIVMEHTSGHEAAATSEMDPFGAALTLMPYLVTTWGKGRFHVAEILDFPHPKKTGYSKALVVEKRR